jgi:hypothetical protein
VIAFQEREDSDGGPATSAPCPARPRPAVFRALGHDDPPPSVQLHGESFTRIAILKHDSWAATAIYAAPGRRAVCKFNRLQPVLVLPMRWLGRLLATREHGFMERLAGIEGIPVSLGPVCIGGRPLPNAVCHEYITGHPLAEHERVADDFFPRLTALLAEVHRRGVAHVDLHKRENILVGDDGGPHLIDFQISFALPSRPRWLAASLAGVLRVLQQSDDYHLFKHRARHRPDQLGALDATIDSARPWWIRAHRAVAVPFRSTRRWLLTRLGIRSGRGHATTEAMPEVAFQGIMKRNLCSPH